MALNLELHLLDGELVVAITYVIGLCGVILSNLHGYFYTNNAHLCEVTGFPACGRMTG